MVIRMSQPILSIQHTCRLEHAYFVLFTLVRRKLLFHIIQQISTRHCTCIMYISAVKLRLIRRHFMLRATRCYFQSPFVSSSQNNGTYMDSMFLSWKIEPKNSQRREFDSFDVKARRVAEARKCGAFFQRQERSERPRSIFGRSSA